MVFLHGLHHYNKFLSLALKSFHAFREKGWFFLIMCKFWHAFSHPSVDSSSPSFYLIQTLLKSAQTVHPEWLPPHPFLWCFLTKLEERGKVIDLDRFFDMTKGHDFSAPQNRIYFVIKWQGFPIAPCLVTIMILCIFCWSLKYFIFHWDTTTQVIARPKSNTKKTESLKVYRRTT